MSSKKNKKHKKKKAAFKELDCYVVVWRQTSDDMPVWAGKSLKAAKAIAEALISNPAKLKTMAAALDMPTSQHIAVEIFMFKNGLLRGRMRTASTPEKRSAKKQTDFSCN